MDIDNTKILIIDDEQSICDACSKVLVRKGCLVETCLEGKSGLEKFCEFKPDIVFIDLKMPGMSGMEVLAKIKGKDANAVIIVITGYATIESATESIKKGAFDFLPKPFTHDELVLISKRALERRSTLLKAEQLREQNERMRQNFVALVSHEMRTPLVAVMQYLEVFSTGIAGAMSEEQIKMVDRMKIRLNGLLLLIDRWLKLSRIDELNLKEDFCEILLGPLIREVISLVQTQAEERNINLRVMQIPDSVRITGDREMIKEVFVNLITNGIKYNKKGGTLSLSVRDNGDFFIVDITDTGIGIAEDDVANLGKEFYRVHKEGIAAGSGLGLAIVKKILDIHGGRLDITSKVNKGSTFSVNLPLSRKLSRKGEQNE